MKRLFIILIAIFIIAGLISIPVSYISKSNINNTVITKTDTTLKTHDSQVQHWIKVYSNQYNVPEKLMEAIFYLETRYTRNDAKYNAHLVGDGGKSFGVGQVQLATAKSVWGDTLNSVITKNRLKNDIQFNVETSIKLIRHLYDVVDSKYSTNTEKTLAVLTYYNSGTLSYGFNKYSYIAYDKYTELNK